MLEALLEFIRDMADALQDTHRRLAEAVSDFLEALLEFINVYKCSLYMAFRGGYSNMELFNNIIFSTH